MLDPHTLDPNTISVVAQVAQNAARATTQVVDMLKGRRAEHALERDARKLLGLNPPPSHSTGYRSESVHPLYERAGTIHPDNEDSLVYVARPHLQRAQELRQLSSEEHVQIALSNDILLFGSPASEGLSRVVFGYSLETTGEFLPFEQEAFEMPYRWVLDGDALHGQPVRRYVRGRRDAPPRPPWAILNVGGNGRLPIYKPMPHRGGPHAGFLEDDYLLVTKIPNFLTPAYSDGSSIISFGGAHGTATRAVRLLLNDKSVLRHIAKQLPPSEGRLPSSYQILLRVYDIDHDPLHGSRPRRIHCIDAVELEPREAYRTWDDAQRAVAPRLDRWLLQGAA
ncbi:MAG: hypothetical protein ACTHOE_09770 [Conexibacter sp.]